MSRPPVEGVVDGALLRPHRQLDGELVFDRATRDAVAGDFGNLIRRTPWGVLRPGSARDIAVMMRWASDHERSITARRMGHSIYGRPLVEDGIVVDMTALDAVHAVTASHAVVESGASWRSVLAATLPRGLTPPVLPTYLDLSVGGTLAVGGIGGTTHTFGMQTDHIHELEVVTGSGRVLSCSPYENPDLFDSVRAGLSQFGIITQATLELTPAPHRVRTYILTYHSLEALASDQRLILSSCRADVVQGAIRAVADGGWAYLLEMAVFHDDNHSGDDIVLDGLADERSLARIDDISYSEYVHAFGALEELLRSTGEWTAHQPWLLTFVPGSTAEEVARTVLDSLDPRDLGDHGQVTFYPLSIEAIDTPMAQMPDEPIVFVLNLVRFIHVDGADLHRILRQNRVAYELVRSFGGSVYPASALALSQDGWQQHYGAAWPRVRSIKQAFDPARCLTPGYEIFQTDRTG